MTTRHRQSETDDLLRQGHQNLHDANSISTATVLTAIVSIAALLFSAISLYQTVLKQANLSVFVPDVVSYTRDPNGGYEVVVIPISMVNSGARDGVVSSMALKVRNKQSGQEQEFEASFFAEPGYFSTKEDLQAGSTRPKRPFAPVSVTGRSGASETVRSYPREKASKFVIDKQGTFEFELTSQMQAVDSIDFIDQFAVSKIAPITFTTTLPPVPPYFDGQMMSGQSVRLFGQRN